MNNRTGVDEMLKIFQEENIQACSIHGGKTAVDRNKSIRDFSLGYKKILISTDLISRGLDFPNIYCVINFDVPNCIEDYIHRIGRTGRLGQKGLAISYLDRIDDTSKENLINLLKNLGQEIPSWINDVEYKRRRNYYVENYFINDISNRNDNNNNDRNDNNNNKTKINENKNEWNNNNKTKNNNNDNEWNNNYGKDNDNSATNNFNKNSRNNNNNWNREDSNKNNQKGENFRRNNRSNNNYNNNFKKEDRNRNDNLNTNNGNYYRNNRNNNSNYNRNQRDNSNNINNNDNKIPEDAFEELFIRGINYLSEENDIKNTFSKYGEVVRCKILRDRETNKSKGIGFVKFKEKYQAYNAMKDAENLECQGRKLKINYSNAKNKENNNGNNNNNNNISRNFENKNNNNFSNNKNTEDKNNENEGWNKRTNERERSREKVVNNEDIDNW